MKPRPQCLGHAALALVFALTGSLGRAATTTYTDGAAYNTALNGISEYAETFASNLEATTSVPWTSPTPTTSNYSTTEGFQFSATPTPGGLRRIATSSDYALSADTAGASITVALPAGVVCGVKSFAASVYLTDSTGAFTSGDVTFALNDGTTQTLTPSAAATGSFCGFVSTSVITSVTVSTTTASAYVTMDDIRLSNADSPRAVKSTAIPVTAAKGAVFPVPPSFSVFREDGTPLSDYSGPVSVVLKGTYAASVTLSGTTTVNAVNGVATFSDLSVNSQVTGISLVASTAFCSVESDMFDVALTTYSPGTTLTSPTASADGVVYFGDSKGIVHAVNTSTGAVVFDRNIKNGEGVAPANAARKPLGRITRWNIGGVPRVFCVTSDNYLMEFALDGTPISTTQLDGGGTAVNASAMALEDAVYVAAANGTDIVVTKLDSAGAVTTSRHFAGTSTSTVSVYGDSVFFSTSYGSYRLKASDLTVTNTYAAGVAPPFVASTASASPVAIVVTADGHVNAYSATTGNAVADFGSSGSVDLELPASVSTYEILGSFSATTGFFPMNVEDFGSLPASPGSSWTSALANGMQFTAAPSAGNLTRLSSNTTPYCLSTDTANSSITLTFTGDVKAVGGRFFVTDDAGTPVSGDVSVTANGTSQTKTIDPANRPFYGVSVPTGISTLTVSPLNSTQHVAMDDVRVCSLPNVTAAPFVYGGKIYVGAVNNSVYCLNMANGSGGGPSGSKVVFDAADVLDSSASAITAGVSVCPTGSGYLLFGSTNGYEISLSLADGEFAGLTFPHAPEQIVSETGATTTDNILIPITSVAAYDPLTGTLLYSAGNSMYQIAPDTFEEGK